MPKGLSTIRMSCPRLLETIRIVDGVPQLLELHQQRIDRSLMEYGVSTPWQVEEYLRANPCPQHLKEVVKCRICYAEEPIEIEYHPYQKRALRSLQCVLAPRLDYHLKWADRGPLQALLERRGGADEVLLINAGVELMDSSYTNVDLSQKGYWYTPRTPLLEGVQRANLIALGILNPRDIPISSLRGYDLIALFNAMMPWDERIELPIAQVYAL